MVRVLNANRGMATERRCGPKEKMFHAQVEKWDGPRLVIGGWQEDRAVRVEERPGYCLSGMRRKSRSHFPQGTGREGCRRMRAPSRQ